MPLVQQIALLDVLLGARALVPPADEAQVRPSDTPYVQTTWAETVIRASPGGTLGRVATLARGTRLAVRGRVEGKKAGGCDGEAWYAVHPFGFVCSRHVRPADRAPDPGPALSLEPGQRLPFAYAFVREDGAPMYSSPESVQLGQSDRTLTKGMSLVVASSTDIDGRRMLVTASGGLVARDDVRWAGQGSAFAGRAVGPRAPGPAFAWTTGEATPVRTGPTLLAPTVDHLPPRTQVPLLERSDDDGPGMWRVGPGRWVQATRLAEVHVIVPPPGTLDADRVAHGGNDQWIDIDLGEQVLVAYRGAVPEFATLVSTGRSHPTPRGNYPIWAKVASMDMENQDYEDDPYLVQGVPWVLLFQGHNAIHGAYWHDRFGHRKSHGCVNLSPRDARFVFEWVAPALPAGWTGWLPLELARSVVVHVRDSSRAPGEQFTQERPAGPPDREAERKKLDAALARRAQELPPAVPAPAPAESPRIDPPPPPDILRGEG
jgi:lipoprotein-anchoring transpeptidase ErfK/SrfK